MFYIIRLEGIDISLPQYSIVYLDQDVEWWMDELDADK